MSFFTVFSKLLVSFADNCLLFFLTLIIALPLGLIISFGSMSRFAVIRLPVRTVVWIIRGTPLMLFLFIVFFGPGLLGLPRLSSRLLAAVVAFSINYGAYFSEIFRGGIESISQGQYEAGHVLGMTKSQIFFKVILFQVVKRIIPPMGNEIITLIKDTALANVISCCFFSDSEIIMKAKDFAADGLIWPLFFSAVFFLVFVGILTILFTEIEKRMNYYNG